jgi:hypothetical protein
LGCVPWMENLVKKNTMKEVPYISSGRWWVFMASSGRSHPTCSCCNWSQLQSPSWWYNPCIWI